MNRFLVGVCFVATTLLAAGCNDSKHTDHANDHEHAHEEAHGPHGGRLLQDGDVSAELKVYEAGTPPHFRLYFSKRGAAIPADSFEASVQLSRLGGAVDKITFRPAGEFQESVQEILEPHSFEVQVSITDNGKTHSWSFD